MGQTRLDLLLLSLQLWEGSEVFDGFYVPFVVDVTSPLYDVTQYECQILIVYRIYRGNWIR